MAVALVIAILAARLLQNDETGTASWDANRASAFAGYLLLWAGTTSGVALNLRLRARTIALPHLLEAHRMLSVLALSFVVAHIVALLVDPVVTFQPWDPVLGVTSEYRRWQVSLGTAATWLAVAVLASTAWAHRMPYGRWRRLHYLAFPAWVLALAHGITAGTDSGSALAVWIYAVTAASTAAIFAVRLFGRGWASAEDAAWPQD